MDCLVINTRHPSVMIIEALTLIFRFFYQAELSLVLYSLGVKGRWAFSIPA